VTGFLFPVDCSPSRWADSIESLVNDRAAYLRMSLAALHEYDERLNWNAAGRSVAQIAQRSLRGSELSQSTLQEAR
jgi:hypothetical protein